jgi:hypothetical protein
VIRTFASSSAVVLAGLLLAPPDSSPPTTEPGSETTQREASDTAAPGTAAEELVEQGGSPEFERELAELAFALFLGNELDVDAGTYSCTEPASLAVGETIICFTLIGSNRVVVATTELTGTSGVYEFVIVSDHQIDPAETTTTLSPSSTVSRATTTALPTPIIVTTVVPLTQADADLLAYGERINAESADLVANLVSGADGIVESADYSWDAQSATVVLSATLSPTYTDSPDTAAWIIARDRAMDLWNRDSPFRAEGTTIRPSLDIAVDDVRYVSGFDLCVEVADQTIAMADWIDRSRVP